MTPSRYRKYNRIRNWVQAGLEAGIEEDEGLTERSNRRWLQLFGSPFLLEVQAAQAHGFVLHVEETVGQQAGEIAHA